ENQTKATPTWQTSGINTTPPSRQLASSRCPLEHPEFVCLAFFPRNITKSYSRCPAPRSRASSPRQAALSTSSRIQKH
ncbi:hypothetical protein JMJ77_0009196, partial [Colletotrichum scovillei]